MAAQSIAYLDSVCLRNFGCPYEVAIALNEGMLLSGSGTKASAYRDQKRNAHVRGISWEFTFPGWVALWEASGHWDKRGRFRGEYCMARHGDLGPYSAANVSIQLSTVNSGEALARVPAHRIGRGVGNGRGWTFANGRYVVHVRAKYVGVFSTQQEAEQAYAAAVNEIRAVHDSKFCRREPLNTTQLNGAKL